MQLKYTVISISVSQRLFCVNPVLLLKSVNLGELAEGASTPQSSAYGTSGRCSPALDSMGSESGESARESSGHARRWVLQQHSSFGMLLTARSFLLFTFQYRLLRQPEWCMTRQHSCVQLLPSVLSVWTTAVQCFFTTEVCQPRLYIKSAVANVPYTWL